ncbi:MAG: potassium channel family protein [Pseudomonadota bacterium]
MLKIQDLRVQIIVSTLFLLLLGGTVLFRMLEDFTWIQAFYFTVTTMTTVGYGDLVPTRDATRLVVAVYILISVTLYVSLVTHIGLRYLEERERSVKKIKEKS